MTRKEKAIELHDKGFNCAQAVACALQRRPAYRKKSCLQPVKDSDLAWAAWQQPVVRYPAQSCLRD